jgi:PhoH-like ATPase
METKAYILDTNVLLSDPSALFSFKEHDLVIPMIVLEELDRHKDRQDEVGRNARETSRKLTEITKEHKAFKDPVPLGAGLGRLFIMSISSLGFNDVKELLPSELEGKSGDNQILALCLALKKKSKQETVLISRDILLRLKANALGITSDDYKKLHVAKSAAGLYSGSAELVGDFDLDAFFEEGKLEFPEEVVKEFHENQYLNVTNPTTNQHALMRLKGCVGYRITEFAPCKINGKNSGQRCAIDALLDPNIPLVTVVGSAGTGKTLLAIASGLHQVLERKQYKSLIVCRPIQPLGKDIGFLPGTMEEKMEPWVAPIKDNLRYLLSADGKKSKRGEETLQMLFENGTIEVEAMTFIRGRSIANAYIIIDEAQNLNAHELKTIITRVGEGTKIVLTGDIEQIDNMYVDSVSNGLTIAIEKFKSYPISGHVTLTKGERSALATLAAQIL